MSDDKRSYAALPLSALVPQVARPVFAKRSPASAQLLADWEQIVGPELGAATYAKRFSMGNLTIACTGVMALELQHRAEMLRARINGALGRVLVERIKFVQEAPRKTGVARKKRVAAAPPPEVDLPEGPLRDALMRLGQRLAEEEG